MKLHQRRVDLLLNIQDTLDYVEKASSKDVRGLLVEAEVALREMLARDVPAGDEATSSRGDYEG